MQLGDLESIAVVGAGQMGQGIAQVCATTGYRVVLCDTTLDRAELGQRRIDERLQLLLQKGKLSAEDCGAASERIRISETEAGVTSVQVVIEDYVHQPFAKVASLVVSRFVHTLLVAGALFAVLDIAFGTTV